MYFKDAHEISDVERDSFHNMGVGYNVVIQEKLDSLAAKNVKFMKKMTADQAVNAKYHHVIDTAMSMTRAIEEMDRDDTTLQTQWSAFTASQATNIEDQFSTKQR